MKIIIRAVNSHEREESLKTLCKVLHSHNPIVLVDTMRRGAFWNFENALEVQGAESAIHLEDDVMLCSEFMKLAIKIINSNGGKIIQFFNRSRNVKSGGLCLGASFSMNQAFFIPTNMALPLLEFVRGYDKIANPNAYDWAMGSYMKKNGLKYFKAYPSLVDHLPVESQINPKWSKYRNAPSFRERH